VWKLLEDLRVPAAKTMMVGDSATDVLTGRNAKVWTCAVTYGFGAASLKDTPPDLLRRFARTAAALRRPNVRSPPEEWWSHRHLGLVDSNFSLHERIKLTVAREGTRCPISE